jgi:hypothetical protein
VSDLTPQTLPPPPPPPPSRPASPAFDFLRPFTFTFEDPRWLNKVLVGGLFTLASFLLIGAFFVLGYLARLIRNVIARAAQPLPEWDDLSAYFGEGVRLFLIMILYAVPMMVLAGFLILPMILSGAIDNDTARGVAAGLGMMFWCLAVPISFAISCWLPAALLFAIVREDFGAAFRFAEIWAFIRANALNYVLAIIVVLVARFLGGFGIILCFIGVIFTLFWSALVSAYAMAELWMLAHES